jgi:hypothetical protein
MGDERRVGDGGGGCRLEAQDGGCRLQLARKEHRQVGGKWQAAVTAQEQKTET